ncbi:UNVERIFIED_CONTAM: chromosome partitioning protein ParA [Methylobacteriaceae bacterium AG10]|uniref:Chromosome partitioning protein ParA n=1 Tax=Methylorubrum podarium TaxID=200476 RepID=A0ABV1QIY7_9HYPH|nr:chromosome partitioning protein ParA [Methylobacteriaceae bacterium AG10]
MPFRNVLPTSSAQRDRDAEQRPAHPEPLPSPRLPKAAVPDLMEGARRPRPAPEPAASTLDAIGQRDEVVRQRIDAMVDRLEDLRSLQDDFTLILQPLASISSELSKASVRIAELESTLSQEVSANGGLRDEVVGLSAKLSRMNNELADSQAQAKRTLENLRERDAAVEAYQIDLRDKLSVIENLERQLFSEVEQNKALASESRALRQEAQAADSALARSEHELNTIREKNSLLEADGRRLQLLSEEQATQLADLDARHRDLTATAEADRQRLRLIETQLATEISVRERNEVQHETELAALRNDRASLAMKLEAASNRAASTEQLLVQARNQLRDKDEEFRSVDRTFKEATIARSTLERRLEALQADLARQADRFLEIQRVRGELDSRCDMLNKALAAKDAAIEQTMNRNAVLNDRIEHLTHRHEAARADLEASNRRLMEELQNERSERALLQGALDIARESRATLQKQHDALKRSGRPWREQMNDEAEDETAQASAEEVSNVRPFTSTGKSASSDASR